jgi:hypothetical protein
MTERGLSVDHGTIWRWVQRYAPVLNQRLRRELRHPNGFWRADETYVRVAGNWTYLLPGGRFHWRNHRLYVVAQTMAAKLFLRLALSGTNVVRPRVIKCGWAPGVCQCHSRTAARRWFFEVDGRFHETTVLSGRHRRRGRDPRPAPGIENPDRKSPCQQRYSRGGSARIGTTVDSFELLTPRPESPCILTCPYQPDGLQKDPVVFESACRLRGFCGSAVPMWSAR